MTKISKAAASVAVSTDELLQQLNAEREDAQPAPVAEGAPAGVVKLPEGSLKVIFLRPSQVRENEHRRMSPGAKPVPAYVVFEQLPDGTSRHWHAHSYEGSATLRVHTGAGRPHANWVPDRIPGTSGTSPTDYTSCKELATYLETTSPVTLQTDSAELLSEVRKAAAPEVVAVMIPGDLSEDVREAVAAVAAFVASKVEAKRDRANFAARQLQTVIASLQMLRA